MPVRRRAFVKSLSQGRVARARARDGTLSAQNRTGLRNGRKTSSKTKSRRAARVTPPCLALYMQMYMSCPSCTLNGLQFAVMRRLVGEVKV